MKPHVGVRHEANAIFILSQYFPKSSIPIATSRFTHQILSGEQRHHQSRKRHLHSTSSKDVAIPVSITPMSPPERTHSATKLSWRPPSSTSSEGSALAVLPFSSILRTFFITSISSSPALLSASTSLLRRMLESKNPLFNIEKNPLLRLLLWETFYKQFCAGGSAAQIARMCADLRRQGYSGVILEYAREVLKDAESHDAAADIATWRAGILASIAMAAPGDLIGLKWSGMGPEAMRRMRDEQPPSEAMAAAMHAVCAAAAQKDLALLPAAEEAWNLAGFHAWSLALQRVYNVQGKSVVYNTYQAYLKQTPGTLAAHLDIARREGFTLGAKLVRGAYLGSEKRELIWDDIEGTHRAYDAIAEALLRRRYNGFLQPTTSHATEKKAEETFPSLNVVLATHNAVSVRSALGIRAEQRATQEELTPLAFAQLQGMADEVSCSLLAAARGTDGSVSERVLKCTTWGTMYECLNYLLRRAAENKDAAGRTVETRKAMTKEIGRRMRVFN